jgi:MFS family permease
MSGPLHPPPSAPPGTAPPALARRGLWAIFGATFFELVGYFMLLPLLLLRLKDGGVSTTLAGLFAASGWIGIFAVTPFASAITQRLGRRPTLWLSALIPVVSTSGFLLTDALPVWFLCQFVAGAASGLRWVLAEAVVAEFAPPHRRGRYVGLFETMVGTTFVIGPVLLALVGPQHPAALWLVLGLLVLGLIGSGWIPKLPPAHDAHEARVGLGGVWHALRAHPLIMTVGFVGGFFESGLTSILPLYGLALGMGAVAAALLVSASGLGSALMMLPAGMAADRLALQPRHGGAHGARVVILHACAVVTLLATLLIPLVAGAPWLAAAVAFVWGGAGGSLYTLAMIDIGSREQGITLDNSTAVLVLSYTLGGVLAPALGAAMLDASPVIGFPALLLAVAGPGWWLLRRERRAGQLTEAP